MTTHNQTTPTLPEAQRGPAEKLLDLVLGAPPTCGTTARVWT
ncbi:Hypothetical protein AA314_03004 [Archangium gephyra]|uniref:Uncharacterized protein n=1 Tax=Archangium gephyra TaxID=48 RepID=A0AAC8TD33_9BACT|nr:hypothetical protein [Archangium gephyra]AKJ01378.1 Hypothetical protein AA314_03004 [Archangium gephyra]